MLELIDLTKQISKDVYREVFPELEARLGVCQREARASGIPVVIVFQGWDAAGKGNLINRLTQALDPRGFQVHSISAPTDTENRYPWMWRFWRALPVAGKVAVFDRSWYGRVLVERVEKLTPKRRWKEAYDEIRQFERQLADAGTLIIKFWLHIDQREQKRRFRGIEKDPAIAWKVGKAEWNRHREYGKWLKAVEEMLERTSTAHAPWTVVEATHGRFARVKVFETVVNRIEEELQRRASKPKATGRPKPQVPGSPTRQQTILDRADLSLKLEREEYEQKLEALQERLFRLEHELYVARIPAAIVYEGWDAAGKGGNIRRLTRGLDPRGYDVVPVAAPNADEKARHYLWRFWRDLPKTGHVHIFDRSWYGRVLVERVEGFCSEEEWKRAYREINEFERQLADFNTVIVKFWLHIDQQEQLRRFEARQQNAYKQWKITDEDWRNRDQWKPYETAVVDMLQRTSTTYAPWTVLEANCKLHARIKALHTVAEALEGALEKA
ncbi:MAG: phosphate--AMP phosphotransferase [Planctomycetota bacterium]|jgi:polyphosphate kinase 2 (PPK2 family)